MIEFMYRKGFFFSKIVLYNFCSLKGISDGTV